MALRAGWRCSSASAEVENAQHGGILLDSACRFPARVEFQAVFCQKPTPVFFAFAAIGIAMKNQDTASASVKKFMEYIDLREAR